MASNTGELQIQICYARADLQLLRDLTVIDGTTIAEAIRLSGVAKELNGVDLAACKVGIYGKLKAMDTRLRTGDRIEIYRPLLADPKEARRSRAKKKN